MPVPPHAPRTSRRILAAIAAIAVLATAPPAGAQDEGTDPAPPADLAEGSALDAARQELPEHLRGVPASSAALRSAEARVVDLEQTIRSNRQIRDTANLQLLDLAARRDVERATITEQRQRRREAGVRAQALRDRLTELAVAAYVGGGRTDDALPLHAASANDSSRQQIFVDAADTTLRERLAQAEAEVADASTRVATARDALDAIVAEIVETTARRDAAEAELARAEPALAPAQQAYRDAFMEAGIDGVDLMTVVAYDAYRQAADGQAACGVTWTVLAGIGRVESRHGTYGGARPQADGTTAPRIIGIALDGRPGIATITDTDGGALDGDAVYDRAVGPMQFIPSTWRSVGRDGNGDGRVDPHNLYDAAAAAAAYLCRSNGNLGNAGNLNAAILSYNRSQAYVDAVLGHRDSYSRLRF